MRYFVFFFACIVVASPAMGLEGASFNSVGPAADCTYHKLQDAIKGIQPNSAGEIHVVAGTLTETEPLVINGNKGVRLYGGYAHCNDAAPQDFNPDLSTLSTVDGSKHTGNAAIAIHDSSDVDIRRFHFTKANNSGQNGGGIYFSSGGNEGHLLLQYVVIDYNTADKGAGIFFDGKANSDTLMLEDYSWIKYNTANDAGGGIRVQGNVVLTMNSSNTTISFNTADPTNTDDGYGGGLQMLDSTTAHIGSPGIDQFAVIDHNNARNGGGIALHDSATAYLITDAPGSRVRIENNTASSSGGGVAFAPGTVKAELCGVGAGINHNTAPIGSAVASTGDGDSYLLVAATCHAASLPGSCAGEGFTGEICNTIDDNVATAPTAPIIAGIGLQTTFEQTELRRNTGYDLIGSDASIEMLNSLAVENILVSTVVAANGEFTMDSCTVANNQIKNNTPVISSSALVVVANSIVWQPDTQMIRNSDPAANDILQDTLTSDVTAIPTRSSSNVTYGVDPQFVNVLSGNYQLQDGSRAIDYAHTCIVGGPDVLNEQRGKVLKDQNEPCDIGAYERQSIPPGHFPSDLTEDFDTDLDAYALELPTGWISGTSGGAQGFFIVSDNVSTGAHSIHADDGASAGESDLISPTFEIGETATLTFDHFYSLETNYDGAILEISINGGAFEDIVAAGGAFVSGGYSGALGPTDSHNPIQEQCGTCMAWTGGNAGFTTVKVNLPHLPANTPVKLRWRVGSDQNYGTPYFYGYYLDHIHVDLNGNSDYIFADGFED